MLFIIRHAHAVDAEEDPKRPLSKRGRKQVRTLAAFLKKAGALDTREIWHSRLARSIQTAELLDERLGLGAKLVEVAGLEGEDDPQPTAEHLQHRRTPLALVGHEPHLSGLLSFLLTGESEPARFVLKKCAAVALKRVDGVWAVRWHVSPELLA